MRSNDEAGCSPCRSSFCDSPSACRRRATACRSDLDSTRSASPRAPCAPRRHSRAVSSSPLPRGLRPARGAGWERQRTTRLGRHARLPPSSPVVRSRRRSSWTRRTRDGSGLDDHRRADPPHRRRSPCGEWPSGVRRRDRPARARACDARSIVAANLEQCAVVEEAGAQVILMASRVLAASAAGPDDYLHVYQAVLVRSVGRSSSTGSARRLIRCSPDTGVPRALKWPWTPSCH